MGTLQVVELQVTVHGALVVLYIPLGGGFPHGTADMLDLMGLAPFVETAAAAVLGGPLRAVVGGHGAADHGPDDETEIIVDGREHVDAFLELLDVHLPEAVGMTLECFLASFGLPAVGRPGGVR